MLVIVNPEYHEEVLAFAEETGRKDILQKELDYLDVYAGEGNTKCFLGKDFAPYSYFFSMERKKDGEWVPWFKGGLIFHGTHDGFGSGGGPTFSVCLTPTAGWAIHT